MKVEKCSALAATPVTRIDFITMSKAEGVYKCFTGKTTTARELGNGTYRMIVIRESASISTVLYYSGETLNAVNAGDWQIGGYGFEKTDETVCFEIRPKAAK
jgi:hypothetical protein